MTAVGAVCALVFSLPLAASQCYPQSQSNGLMFICSSYSSGVGNPRFDLEPWNAWNALRIAVYCCYFLTVSCPDALDSVAVFLKDVVDEFWWHGGAFSPCLGFVRWLQMLTWRIPSKCDWK